MEDEVVKDEKRPHDNEKETSDQNDEILFLVSVNHMYPFGDTGCDKVLMFSFVVKETPPE
jgi:hypothetical protein